MVSLALPLLWPGEWEEANMVSIWKFVEISIGDVLTDIRTLGIDTYAERPWTWETKSRWEGTMRRRLREATL